MCGITGFCQQKTQAASELEAVAWRMSDAMLHRGPDDGGVWVDEACGVALCNRRLAIQDVSPLGHMPMTSACERFVISQNGEVYNFHEMRRDLEADGVSFRSGSDTEVIVEGVVRWGVEATVKRCNGMFAMAIWDRKERKLYLVRDRLGIKPLYYGWSGSTFLFGSELKALHQHPDFSPKINRDSLALFMRHNYIPAPYSIFDGIHKLPQGHFLTISGTDPSDVELTPFWTAKNAVERGLASPFEGSEADAMAQLNQLLRDAVRLRMIADVPLGAFLSGGVDSSTVVALMQAQSDRPVKSFSIGFHEASYNEAEDAKRVAQHLGTDHTELYVTPEDAQAVVPMLGKMYDEPFSDSSQIPTYLVSELTRKHVTVSLSGDGGDELFAGYNRYFFGVKMLKRIAKTPKLLRSLGAKGIQTLSPKKWDQVFQTIDKVLPDHLQVRLPGDKLYKLSNVLHASSPELMYRTMVSQWRAPHEVVLQSCEPPTALTDQAQWVNAADFVQRMMYLDLITYLPDDILAKVDRASMAVSLEARVPILDHRVVEFAWTLPLSMHIQQQKSKWMLRKVLYQYVPQELIERPKMGFGVPIEYWLRGPLKEWAEAMLHPDRLRREGFFDPEPIQQKWQEHLSGKRSWQYLLWNVLMFQAWYDEWFN